MPRRPLPDAELAATMMRRGWLSLIPPDVTRRVLRASVQRIVASGNSLYEAGDEPGAVYGLVQGVLAISVTPGNHGPFHAHFVRPGDWVGAASEVTNATRIVSVVAVRRSLILVLPRRAIESLAAETPEFWRYLAVIVVENLNTAMAAWADLLIVDSHQRLSTVILRMAGYEPGDPVDREYEIQLSQSQIAEISRLSRNSANLVLRDFEEAGLLVRRYGIVRLTDIEGLRRVAGVLPRG